jgi:hypothetical protein
MREQILQHAGGDAAEVLCLLEGVRSADEAKEAGKAFRTWIANALDTAPNDISKKQGSKRAGVSRSPAPKRSPKTARANLITNAR